MGFLIPPHLLTNFEIQKYYQSEPRFNGVFSRNNLPKKNKGWGIRNKTLMNMQMLVHIGFLYFVAEMKFFISIVFGVEQVS